MKDIWCLPFHSRYIADVNIIEAFPEQFSQHSEYINRGGRELFKLVGGMEPAEMQRRVFEPLLLSHLHISAISSVLSVHLGTIR